MNLAEAMQQLEAFGSEQTRKTWRRHGGADPMFGVKFGDLAKLQKAIKVDHPLALQLWDTGNLDARLLACMVADAGAITEKQLKAWAADAKDTSVPEGLAALAARTKMAAKIRDLWIADKKLQRAGWAMVGYCAKEGIAFDDALALDFLQRIEANIHQAENWTRRTMMHVAIGIGGRTPSLRKAAENAIARIGPVAFDPGDTACEFPDALPYIAKMWARKKA